jgi:hypothetical protein
MTKETIEEVKMKLAALKLSDVTVNEIVTLVTEPLAHIEVKSADGGRLQIWTHAAVFSVDLAACRIGVAAELTAGLHEARGIVAEAVKTGKTKRGRRRNREQEENQREEAMDPAPEITEGLAQDVAKVVSDYLQNSSVSTVQSADDDSDDVEEVVS